MATYIFITRRDDDDLSKKNLDQIEEYRKSLLKLRGEELFRLEQQDLNGTRGILRYSDLVAGLRRGGEMRFGHVNYYTHAAWPSGYWTVFSGDYTASVSGSESFIPSLNGTSGTWFWVADFVLPVKQDICLLVLMGRLKEEVLGSGGSGAGYFTRKYVNKVYLVADSSVREVNVPAKLKTILDILNPPYPEADFESFEPPGVNTSPLPPRQIYEAAVGWAVRGSGTVEYTPTIFELLNRTSAYVDNQVIRQFPSTLKPITGDFRYGYYADDPVDKSLYYAKWLGDPGDANSDDTGLLQGLPRSTLWIPSAFRYPNVPGWENGYDPQERHLVAWTWESPTYCRLLCGALGFSDEDLTP